MSVGKTMIIGTIVANTVSFGGAPRQDCGIRVLEEESYRTGVEVFGADNVNHPQERLVRFGEEAMELLQSGGITREVAQAILDYVYERPIEPEISKEFAGSLLTLFTAARAHEVDLLTALQTEIARILAKKEQCRVKHEAKPREVRAR